MKKKIAVLLLASAMAVTVIAGCGAKTEETSKTTGSDTKKDDKYQFVSAADAVKAAKAGDKHVLDVREWDNYAKGRVADSMWSPIFPLEDESLADNMADYAKDNLSDGKDIYIICNSGQKGAQKTTEVLEKSGIDKKSIYTVEGGAKALAKERNALTTVRADEKIDWKYISAKDALADKEAQILDVRDDDTYADGHLDGSLQTDLKDIESADAQTAMYKLAADKLDKEKPIYLLCYSGNKCAKTGISVMKDAGFDTDKLFIIKDGAKDADIQAAFVK